jgi:CRISPR/Cas system endoribonuclease Cas6 (RAMP superfamily)
MKFGGLIGSITYEGKFDKFLPLLKLGEFIHIGKNTTFGLGKYKINVKV